MRIVAFLLAAAFGLNAAPGSGGSRVPVTVLLDFDGPYSAVSFQALQHELPGIFAPAALKIDLRLKSDLPKNPEFGELVVFKMKGSCTMNALPLGALSDERGPLAMTYSVDGNLLPFGEVECDRVRESVQRTVGRGDPEAHQTILGKALARVMAHEMYHMLAKSGSHTSDGITRKSLSGRQLSEGELILSDEARLSIRDASHRKREP